MKLIEALKIIKKEHNRKRSNENSKRWKKNNSEKNKNIQKEIYQRRNELKP
jgi:hypothetical protein